MKILKDRSVFENDKATCYHHIGDEHFAMVVHDYVIFDQRPSDFRRDMLLFCQMYCRARSWEGYYHHRIAPHFLQVSLVHSGETCVHCGSEYWSAEAGDVILLPPLADYEFVTPKRCERSSLLIEGQLLHSLLAESGLEGRLVVTPAGLDFLENRFSQVGQSLAKAHNQEERRRIFNLCFEILQYLAAPPPELLYPPALTKVLGLIDSDYGRPLSIADFTAAGGVSESGLARLFRRYLHTTPYRYLTSHRMRQAEMMLLQGVLSVKEIAARVGYDNPLNFSTEFKKFFGSSPRNFHR